MYGNGNGDFRSILQVDTNQSMKKEENKYVLVISDLHGDAQKWKKVKELMIRNPGMQLVILGDAMDRGEAGIQILLQIKELNETNPEMVKYLPGNHDIFTYNYLRESNHQIIRKDAILQMLGNGGEKTIEDLCRLSIAERRDLMQWLGRQPIQAVQQVGEKKYYLSHAVFDNELYDSDKNFNLEKAYLIRQKFYSEREAVSCDKKYSKFLNSMWYRENTPNTHYAKLSLPTGGAMVVGHTPKNRGASHGVRAEIIGGMQAWIVDCGRAKEFSGALLTSKGIITQEIQRDDGER